MKFKIYKSKILAVTICILLFSLGMFAGYATIKSEMTERITVAENDKQFMYDLMLSYESELAVTIENWLCEKEEKEALQNEYDNIQEELLSATKTITDLKNEEYELVYIGDFKITYYCDSRYKHICGGSGVTASGKATEVGITAAADWSVLPKGSIIYIEEIGFREIQDVGGGVNGNHIDVLVKEHQEALSLGIDHEGVWVLVKKNY